MVSKTALITGVTGQDGAYLAAYLLEKGYTVHGTMRRSSAPNHYRLDRLGLTPQVGGAFHLHYADLTDAMSLMRLIAALKPDEIYNLAAQSDVAVSFSVAAYTHQANGLGAVHLLEAVRHLGMASHVRYYQASTSELYGDGPVWPQNEETPFRPCSPYGVAKLTAYWSTVNYRHGYQMHASNGILFNHESPLRGPNFVTRKVTIAVAEIATGQRECLMIGNLNAKRDWGHAKDSVDGIWHITQHKEPGDYVLATGETHSVREFIERAFACIGADIQWQGEGVHEQGIDRKTGKVRVQVDPQFFRPTEVPLLCGDPSKVRRELGWQHRISFEQLVTEMVESDIAQLKAQLTAQLTS
jgi:GDPmannose 4,6-dehydratase